MKLDCTQKESGFEALFDGIRGGILWTIRRIRICGSNKSRLEWEFQKCGRDFYGIFYVFFYTIAMLKFFSNYSSRSNLRVFYYFLELLWKILCIKRFYFLNYFIFFVIVFRIIRNMKETSSLINFSNNLKNIVSKNESRVWRIYNIINCRVEEFSLFHVCIYIFNWV